MDQDGNLHGDKLSPDDFQLDIVFDANPATPEKGHTHPHQFLAHVYCSQTAGWMKTPLGTEVHLDQATLY